MGWASAPGAGRRCAHATSTCILHAAGPPSPPTPHPHARAEPNGLPRTRSSGASDVAPALTSTTATTPSSSHLATPMLAAPPYARPFSAADRTDGRSRSDRHGHAKAGARMAAQHADFGALR
eukprot:364927-Chlamydomonas_euryale.AAC.17